MIKVHAGIGFLGNDLALTNAGNRDRKSEPVALILEYCRGGCLDRKLRSVSFTAIPPLRIVAHGDFVPAELSQAVCLPSDSFCDLQVY